MRFDHLFLDVAGTLLYKPDTYAAIQSALARFQVEMPVEYIRSHHLRLVESMTFPDETTPAFYAAFNRKLLHVLGLAANPAMVRTIHEECRELEWHAAPGFQAVDVLPIPIGIISNWDRSLPGLLEKKFGRSFSPILGSQSEGVRKPDPALYARACERAGVKPERALYVGDSIELDIEPAASLGIHAVLLDRWGEYPYFSGPRIRSLTELPAIIETPAAAEPEAG